MDDGQWYALFDNPPQPGHDSVKWEFARRIADDLEPYWVADMDFAAPQPVLEALHGRLSHGVFGYTFARESLFEAFREWQWERFRVEQPDAWCWLPGVMAGVRGAVSCFSEPGDTIIVQTPVYFPFMDAVQGQNRTLAVNQLTHDGTRYRFDLEDLERHAEAGAEVLLLCSPHNPVGRVWESDELQAMIDICRRHNIVLVSDEIHGDLTMPEHEFVPIAALDCDGARVLTLSSATKSFNIPGLPGALATSTDAALIDPIRAHLHAVGADTPNVLTLQAVEAAYRRGHEWLDAAMAYIAETERQVRRILESARCRVTVEPLEATYLLWINCKDVSVDDVKLRRRLQEGAKAWLVEGSKFGSGGEGYLRMNIAAPRARVCGAAQRVTAVLDEVR